MGGKNSGVNAVDDLRESTRHTREDLSDTMTALRDKADLRTSTGRRAGGWAAAALGVLAGVAAILTMRWRKARKTPKSRAERAWREVKSRVRKTAARVS
jgi:hypothetical protein